MPSLINVTKGIALAAREVGRAAFDRAVPGGSLPLHASDVTPDWLARALRVPPGSIRSVEIVDEHSGTAARARIAVIADGQLKLPDHLFVKFMPHNFLQHAMMNLFQLGRREVVLYQTLGASPPVRVPRCYFAEFEQARGRNVMVMEDLTGKATFRTVVDSLAPAEAEAVVDALADLHVAYWERRDLPIELGTISGMSPASAALADIIRKQFIGNMKGPAADIVPAQMQRAAHIMFERSAEVDAMWAAQPQTLIHGDPHLGNLFFQNGAPGFLDWQVACVGSGVRDLAYFATASVEPKVLRTIERGLVERYTHRLQSAGITIDAEKTWSLYRAGVTEFFVSAVAAAEAGERAQPSDIALCGVERATAAAIAHDSFGILATLVEGNRL